MNGQKIISLKEKVTWLDNFNYRTMLLRKLSEVFGLTTKKSWYPLLFNKAENMNYIGPLPVISYYGVEQMRKSERKAFLS
jgi:DNA polymerase type B, organellar and viral.